LKNTLFLKMEVAMFKNESDLRSWLRKVWGDGLNWVEPAYGSTLGMPDTQIPVGKSFIPVELKIIDGQYGHWAVDVRPSQIRWHEKNHLAGKKSAFLLGAKGTNAVYLVPGWSWPGSEDWVKNMAYVADKRSILTTLKDKAFWRGRGRERGDRHWLLG
jgi:hypothetical protein